VFQGRGFGTGRGTQVALFPCPVNRPIAQAKRAASPPTLRSGGRPAPCPHAHRQAHLPHCEVAAALRLALVHQVAVGQQHGVGLGVGLDARGVPFWGGEGGERPGIGWKRQGRGGTVVPSSPHARSTARRAAGPPGPFPAPAPHPLPHPTPSLGHDVGAVQEVGDAAEALGLALQGGGRSGLLLLLLLLLLLRRRRRRLRQLRRLLALPPPAPCAAPPLLQPKRAAGHHAPTCVQ
jgi:hypothetical protein